MTQIKTQAIQDARHYKGLVEVRHFTGEGADYPEHPDANLCDVAATLCDYGEMEQEEWDQYRDAFVAECEQLFGLKAYSC